LEANDLVLEHNLQTTADGTRRIHVDLWLLADNVGAEPF
jgi:hypothetical protein